MISPRHAVCHFPGVISPSCETLRVQGRNPDRGDRRELQQPDAQQGSEAVGHEAGGSCRSGLRGGSGAAMDPLPH